MDSKSVLIYGRQPVIERLRVNPRSIKKIYFAYNIHGEIVNQISQLCEQHKIQYEYLSYEEMDNLINSNHQGVIAECEEIKLSDWKNILSSVTKHTVITALAEVEDPHNVGAIIRTCAGFGINNIVLTKHHSSGITPTVIKGSAGAVDYINTSIVNSLPQRLEELKQHGVWIYGATAQGASLEKVEFVFPLCLVVGSEGKGLPKLVNEKCDYKISIPIKKISSYNVSVATGIILYEINKQLNRITKR